MTKEREALSTVRALKLALEALKYPINQPHENFNVDMAELLAHRAITAIEEALMSGTDGARPAVTQSHKQEPVACVYKATTKKGETAHFGEYSAAKAWAGWGIVEQVPLKTLTLIQKSLNPCPTCEALARTVMLDQTSHDTTPPQRKPLTDEEIILIVADCASSHQHTDIHFARAIEAKLKEKNT